jgi:DNA/RNA-binding domain of Phe-tRNA-synthetase-like protein
MGYVMELCNIIETLVSLDEDVKKMEIFIAYTIAWRESNISTDKSYPFEIEFQKLIDYIRSKYTLETLKNDIVVRAYREFFWRIGIDPTKTRPSSEALVRRILRGSFPRINPVVDAGNIASAYTMVPIGIYDLDYCKLPLILRLSKGDEIFRPIGGSEEKLEKDIPILVDSKNTVMHIYPHRDSIETMIRDSTCRILIIGAGVDRVDRNLVKKAAELVVSLLTKIGWDWCKNVFIKP